MMVELTVPPDVGALLAKYVGKVIEAELAGQAVARFRIDAILTYSTGQQTARLTRVEET